MDHSEYRIDHQYSYYDPNDPLTSSLMSYNLKHSTSSLVRKDIKDLLQDAKSPVTDNDADSITSEHFEHLFHHPETSGEKRTLSPSSQTSNKQHAFHSIPSLDDDPYFRMLFNKTQVLLLRRNFSLDFLVILKRYISLLLEEGQDPMLDQYVLELQNELDKGWELTQAFLELVDTFLTCPANPWMMLASLEQRNRRATFQSIFSRWRLQTELNLSLKQLGLIWDNYVQRKYLRVWQEKVRFKCKDLRSEADCLINFKSQSNTLDQWMKRTDAQKVKQDLADAFFLQKHLKLIEKISLFQRNHLKLADHDYEARCVKRAFSTWRLETRYQHSRPQLGAKSVRLFFKKVVTRSAYVRSLADKALLLERVLLLTPVVKIWRANLTEKQNKMKDLVELETIFREKMALKVLKDVTDWKEREAFAVKSLDTILVKFVFRKVWLKRLREKFSLHEYRSKRKAALSGRYFSIWRARYCKTFKAFSHYERVLARKALRGMRFKQRDLEIRRTRSETWARVLLLRWSNQAKLEKLLKRYQIQVVLSFWNHEWKRKYKSFKDLSTITVKCRDSFLVKEHLEKWIRKYKQAEELKRKANIFAKLRAISKMKRTLPHSERLNLFSLEIATQINHKHKKKYLSLWKSSVQIQRRLKQEIVLDQYLTLREKAALKDYMALWSSRFRYFSLDCTIVADRQRYQNVASMVLQKALDKLQLHENWRLVSIELDNQSKMSNCLGDLKLKYTRISAMRKQLDRVVSEKDLSTLVKCMNMWTMKELKCSRNSETVDIFKNRWNRASLRAILLLWKEKLDSFNSEQPASIVKKSPDNQEQDQSLITPTRIKNSGRITIPGSERMKQNRMEAMRNHYRRARKAIPSPIRFSEKLDTVTKRRLEVSASSLENREISPPPIMDLEKINKKLASRKSTISFKSIPDAKLSPLTSPQYSPLPVVDRSLLSQHSRGLERSPSIR
ncbi:LANO_0E14598g1_1 [Lachancea nothofagi CBS 11611]|uniref:LANO_0E14598g1_1 n=1 Tax=Lachancea nothofagi CBS 11611 TaxID=1266666 RepID=A0A1G4K064_9SACH|nr:LANO_0E14598g1_1 [Lachancea nothofagi CBS 11611]